MFRAMPSESETQASTPPGSAALATPAGSAAVDAQDPLPESNWIPRRWFSFLGFWSVLLMEVYALRLGAPSGVQIALVILAALIAVLYLVAPSAEQFGRIVQHASALRSGVVFKSTSSADVSAGTVSTEQTAGKAGAAGVAPE